MVYFWRVEARLRRIGTGRSALRILHHSGTKAPPTPSFQQVSPSSRYHQHVTLRGSWEPNFDVASPPNLHKPHIVVPPIAFRNSPLPAHIPFCRTLEQVSCFPHVEAWSIIGCSLTERGVARDCRDSTWQLTVPIHWPAAILEQTNHLWPTRLVTFVDICLTSESFDS